MSNKKKQFDQEFKQNAVNYCLTHPELSRKECAKNLGIVDSTLYRWKQEAKANNNQATFKGSGNLTETELENRRLKRELKGEGFVKKVNINDRVNKGQPIVCFDKEMIEEKGYNMITMMIVVNDERISKLEKGDQLDKLLIKVQYK